jgi:hypothetical protein
MSQKTKCLTNGAIYHTHIHDSSGDMYSTSSNSDDGNTCFISVKVDLPFELNIGKKEAKILTKLIHNQMELVLRPYFKQLPFNR